MSVLKSVFFATLVLLSGTIQAGQIDKAMINSMLSEIDAAAQKKDPAVVVKYISPDAKITMHINAGGQKQVLKVTRAQYLELLQQGWTMSSNYQYQRSNTRIKIMDGGNKAIVTANVTESMNIQGQTVKGTSQETSTIELVNGRAMITELVGETEM